jgi:hypothetical protein
MVPTTGEGRLYKRFSFLCINMQELRFFDARYA